MLKFYTKGFLDKNMLMCVTLGIVFYSLWTVDAGTIERVGGEQVVWTVPLVIVIFLKYSMSIEGKSDGDPVEVVLKDKLLMALVALLGIALFLIVYSRQALTKGPYTPAPVFPPGLGSGNEYVPCGHLHEVQNELEPRGFAAFGDWKGVARQKTRVGKSST